MVLYSIPMISSEDFREFLLCFAGHNPKYLIALSEEDVFTSKQAQVSTPPLLPRSEEQLDSLPAIQLGCSSIVSNHSKPTSFPSASVPDPVLVNTLAPPFSTNLFPTFELTQEGYPSLPETPKCKKKRVTSMSKSSYEVPQSFFRTTQTQQQIPNSFTTFSFSHTPYPLSSPKNSFNTITAACSEYSFPSSSYPSIQPRRQRVSLACQQCRKKKKRCSGETDGTCKRCYNAGEHCSFMLAENV